MMNINKDICWFIPCAVKAKHQFRFTDFAMNMGNLICSHVIFRLHRARVVKTDDMIIVAHWKLRKKDRVRNITESVFGFLRKLQQRLSQFPRPFGHPDHPVSV